MNEFFNHGLLSHVIRSPKFPVLFTEKAMRPFKIATIFLSVTAFFLGIVTVWMALFPELFFTEYLMRWEVAGTLVSITIAFLSLLASPFRSLGVQIRNGLAKRGPLSFLLIALVCVQAAGVDFVLRFDDPYATRITRSILDGNYVEADRELGSVDYSADKIAYLHMVNGAISQDFFSTNQSADENLCRVYVNYFQKRNVLFGTAWERYLGKYALASCARVLGSNADAIRMYQDAGRLARWIATDEERRAERRLAAVYLYDRQGTAGITDPAQRYRRVVDLLGTDSHPTAQRMRGSAYYLLGDFARATETWSKFLPSMPEDEAIERKMLHNNLAMAYAALKQFRLALDVVEEGISLPFDEDNQTERREQVRLMSTKALSLLADENCSRAESTWKLRNALTRQPLGSCSSLISAQIHACNGSLENQEQVLADVLVGIGQQPEEFRDRTEAALMALVDQAESAFASCYLGLTFDAGSVRSAMRTIVTGH